ncbi:hypothetical protein VM57_09500 [Stenotrophomonas maltophilia]|uniref:Uncharacterized protein n=1 Tax=Stenotrophomonas maltophilia TaxID=40324 RepID=A0A0F5ZNN6_STEMA|nr:hypothetical protein VM57_09500 [Stenotrophomonas maltophilia]
MKLNGQFGLFQRILLGGELARELVDLVLGSREVLSHPFGLIDSLEGLNVRGGRTLAKHQLYLAAIPLTRSIRSWTTRTSSRRSRN